MELPIFSTLAGYHGQRHVKKPAIIAHRGACGYLPEHTLEAKALAYGMGADYLEQDLVLTRDGVPIVFHDIYLDAVTDVSIKFPHRKRSDGRHYVIDFDLEEIKKLRVWERLDLLSAKAVFPRRYPARTSEFDIPSFEEEIVFIQGLNHSTGKNVGIYPEIKGPAWHRKEGKDISKQVLAILQKYGYQHHHSPVHLQCFDHREIKRLRKEFSVELKIVQLIDKSAQDDTGTDYGYLMSDRGLEDIAEIASGIGPWIPQVLSTDLCKRAQLKGLVVHPYTLRTDELPKGYKDLHKLLDELINIQRVDGLFTDFPDTLKSYLENNAK